MKRKISICCCIAIFAALLQFSALAEQNVIFNEDFNSYAFGAYSPENQFENSPWSEIIRTSGFSSAVNIIEDEQDPTNKLLRPESYLALVKRGLNVTGNVTLTFRVKEAQYKKWSLHLLPNDNNGVYTNLSSNNILLSQSGSDLRHKASKVSDTIFGSWYVYQVALSGVGTANPHISIKVNNVVVFDGAYLTVSGLDNATLFFSADWNPYDQVVFYDISHFSLDYINITETTDWEQPQNALFYDNFDTHQRGIYHSSNPLANWSETGKDSGAGDWSIASDPYDSKHSSLMNTGASSGGYAYLKKSGLDCEGYFAIEFSVWLSGNNSETTVFLQPGDSSQAGTAEQLLGIKNLGIYHKNVSNQISLFSQNQWHKIKLYGKRFGTSGAKLLIYADGQLLESYDYPNNTTFNSSSFVLKSNNPSANSTYIDNLVVSKVSVYPFEITSPKNGAVTFEQTPEIAGTGEEGSDIEVTVGSQVLETTVINGIWRVTPSQQLAEGTYTVSAKSTITGEVLNTNSTFRIDNEIKSVINQTSYRYQGETEQAEQLEAGKTLTISADLRANGIRHTVILAAVLYDADGNMVKYAIGQPQIVTSAGNFSTETVSITMPENISGKTLKLLAWEGQFEMLPMMFETASVKRTLSGQ